MKTRRNHKAVGGGKEALHVRYKGNVLNNFVGLLKLS